MKKKNLLISKILITLFTFLVIPLSVFADDPPSFADGNLEELVNNILGYLFPIAGIICLIFIVQGGYMWIISAGDPDRIKQAQGTLTWAVLGLIFVMLIYALLEILLRFVYSA